MKILMFMLIFMFIRSSAIPGDELESVHATVYHAVPEQCNSDPEHTAFNFKLDLRNPYAHRIIAVSRDLLKKYPKGTTVYVGGVGQYEGYYVVMDKMNKRYTKRIDILINVGMPLISTNTAWITKE